MPAYYTVNTLLCQQAACQCRRTIQSTRCCVNRQHAGVGVLYNQHVVVSTGSMPVSVRASCLRKVAQLVAGRRSRNVWMLTATLLVVTWLFSSQYIHFCSADAHLHYILHPPTPTPPPMLTCIKYCPPDTHLALQQSVHLKK